MGGEVSCLLEVARPCKTKTTLLRVKARPPSGRWSQSNHWLEAGYGYSLHTGVATLMLPKKVDLSRDLADLTTCRKSKIPRLWVRHHNPKRRTIVFFVAKHNVFLVSEVKSDKIIAAFARNDTQ